MFMENAPKMLKQKQKERIYIATGSAQPELAEAIADAMGTRVGDSLNKQFANGEMYFKPQESVRGKHFLAIQSLASCNGLSINDYIFELAAMVDSAVRASASEVTVVVPYLGYSRQERKATGREPIMAAALTGWLQTLRANRIVSVDLHAPATQGTFRGPFDHLTANPLIIKSLKSIIGNNSDKFVIVSPDEGRAKESAGYAEDLNLDIVHMTKSRKMGGVVRPTNVDGVHGRTAIMIDDILDTGGTLISAAQTLERSGAGGVMAVATHGLFSGDALKNLPDAPISKIIVTDTVPQNESKQALGDKLEVLSSGPMIGRALYQIVTNGSVSELFSGRNAR